jgi:hypothetical protein
MGVRREIPWVCAGVLLVVLAIRPAPPSPVMVAPLGDTKELLRKFRPMLRADHRPEEELFCMVYRLDDFYTVAWMKGATVRGSGKLADMQRDLMGAAGEHPRVFISPTYLVAFLTAEEHEQMIEHIQRRREGLR